ncbi:MAG: hypothetical protein R3B91_13415 [Planctomycetaceae bacterium]
MSQTRREFMGTVSQQRSYVSRSKVDANDDPPSDPGYIDAHSHIWTRDIEAYPLANGNTLDDLKPPSFTTEELLELVRPHGVTRIVLIQHRPYHGSRQFVHAGFDQEVPRSLHRRCLCGRDEE